MQTVAVFSGIGAFNFPLRFNVYGKKLKRYFLIGLDLSIPFFRYHSGSNVYNKSNGFSINVNNNLTTGLVSIQEQSGIAIFPNPTNSMVTISSIEKLKEIEIHNIIGDLIYKTSTINKQTTIDLKGQPKGIYYVKTTDNKNNVINNILIVQ